MYGFIYGFRFIPVSPRYSSSTFMHSESFNRTIHHGHTRRMMFKLHEKDNNKSLNQVIKVRSGSGADLGQLINQPYQYT